jgi:hypothetical protein
MRSRVKKCFIFQSCIQNNDDSSCTITISFFFTRTRMHVPLNSKDSRSCHDGSSSIISRRMTAAPKTAAAAAACRGHRIRLGGNKQQRHRQKQQKPPFLRQHSEQYLYVCIWMDGVCNQINDCLEPRCPFRTTNMTRLFFDYSQ